MNEVEKEYLLDQWKSFKNAFRTNEAILFISVIVASFIIFDWFGRLITLALYYYIAEHLYLGGYYLTSYEEPNNTCSAGIENCKICNNEYSHEWNVKYESKRKWYQVY